MIAQHGTKKVLTAYGVADEMAAAFGGIAGLVTGGVIATTPRAMDWSATQIIKRSDAKLAYELGKRAEAFGFVTDAELQQLAKPVSLREQRTVGQICGASRFATAVSRRKPTS